MRWTWSQVRARRLERHRLSGRPSGGDCAEVAALMCGAHAQVMSAAELSIALRCKDVTRSGVRRALAPGGTLVKTFGPRGTVHLLAAADLAMWTGALSAVPSPGAPSAPSSSADFRMTSEQTDEVVTAIAQALAGDDELTVDELEPLVLHAVGPWAADQVMPAFGGFWPRWRQAIPVAGHRGVLCFGAGRGRAVTYSRPSALVPGFRPGGAAESLRELVRRYLSAFGPATPAQFAQWLAAPIPWAARAFDSLSEELTVVALDGAEAWMLAADRTPPPGRPSGVRLLPYFDSYVVGSHPRARVFPGVAGQRALSRTGQAGTMPVLLVDGEVAGIWRTQRSGKRLRITVEPFARPDRPAAPAVGTPGRADSSDPGRRTGAHHRPHRSRPPPVAPPIDTPTSG